MVVEVMSILCNSEQIFNLTESLCIMYDIKFPKQLGNQLLKTNFME